MRWSAIRQKYRMWAETRLAYQMFELGLSLVVGLIVGVLLVVSWDLSSDWQGLIAVVPIAVVFVLLINDLEKIVLASLAISVPLNLDVSVLISPYARTLGNIAKGYRTIVALTELRLSLVTVLLLIGYALWITKSRRSGRKQVRFFAGTTVPALGLIFMSVLSVSQARDWQLSLFLIVQLLELFLAYFYLANHIRTIKELQFFLAVSTGALLAESALMIAQWITGLEFKIAGIEAVIYGGQVVGTLSDKGATAAYISAHALIASAMIWASPQKSFKVLSVCGFIAGSIALISTGSRIAWIAYAATVLIFVLFGFWRGLVKRKTLVGLLVIVLIIGGAFYNAIYTRFMEEDRGSAESRPKMYRLAWNVIEENMWLGVGANNYALVARDYYTTDVGDLGYVINSLVHNRYLAVWAETGLFGFLFYVALLASPIIMTVQYIIKSHDRSIKLIALGFCCALISLCIQMYTSTFHVRPITLFVWLLIGLVASLHNLEQTYAIPEQVEALGGHAYLTDRPGLSQLAVPSQYVLEHSAATLTTPLTPGRPGTG